MSEAASWLAFDIGGANLKVADGLGFAASKVFSLWREPDRLAESIRSVLDSSPAADRLAVTMTGELADCYETKVQGVSAILAAVEYAADGRDVNVYRNDGLLVSLQAALRDAYSVASANWHALARFAGRFIPNGAGLLIDVGSTTTDIIGLWDGQPPTPGSPDPERLMSGELVYTGITRSPIAGIVHHIPYRGHDCPVAQELFATSLDAHLTLEHIKDQPADFETADGRPATKKAARDRLARMICADRNSFEVADAREAAAVIVEAQLHMISEAVRKVAGRLKAMPSAVVVAGRGDFLARCVAEKMLGAPTIISLRERLNESASNCAPAHALAVLAREGIV